MTGHALRRLPRLKTRSPSQDRSNPCQYSLVPIALSSVVNYTPPDTKPQPFSVGAFCFPKRQYWRDPPRVGWLFARARWQRALAIHRSSPGDEAVPVDQQDAARRQFVNRIVEGFTVAAPVVKGTPWRKGSFLAINPCGGRERGIALPSECKPRFAGFAVCTPARGEN